MKSKIVLLSIALLAISCSNDSNSSDPVDSTPILLTKLVDDNETYTYMYNGSKIVQEKNITNGEISSYTYTGDLITKIVNTSSNGSPSTEIFTYDSSNRLIKAEETSNSFNTVITYNYLASDHVTIIEKDTNGNYIKTYTKDAYLNADGSLKNYTQTILATQNGTVVESGTGNLQPIVYDNKNNPYKNITGFKNIQIYRHENGSSIHNITSYKSIDSTTSSTGGSGSSSNIFTVSYQYNSNDFPAQSIEKGYNINNVVTGTYNITYEYNHN
jgi:YD repeat-containing protein